LRHDVHHRLTPIEAARLGKSLEPYHLFWLEDAVTAELQEGFRICLRYRWPPPCASISPSIIFGIQEYMMHTKDTDEVFPHSYSFKDGFLYPGDGPASGLITTNRSRQNFPTSARICP
jgi:L-alanine-DL-glutamate epimerase-like enolase superfamily enzyme